MKKFIFKKKKKESFEDTLSKSVINWLSSKNQNESCEIVFNDFCTFVHLADEEDEEEGEI